MLVFTPFITTISPISTITSSISTIAPTIPTRNINNNLISYNTYTIPTKKPLFYVKKASPITYPHYFNNKITKNLNVKDYCSYNRDKFNATWTYEELVMLIRLHNSKITTKWNMISKLIKTHSSSQCNYMIKKMLKDGVKIGDLTDKTKDILFEIDIGFENVYTDRYFNDYWNSGFKFKRRNHNTVNRSFINKKLIKEDENSNSNNDSNVVFTRANTNNTNSFK